MFLERSPGHNRASSFVVLKGLFIQIKKVGIAYSWDGSKDRGKKGAFTPA